VPLRQRYVRTQLRRNCIRSGLHGSQPLKVEEQRVGLMYWECIAENPSRAAALRAN